MSCQKTIEDLSSYLDGELEADLRRTIETHLKMCRHCQVVFDTTRKTLELYCDGKLFPLPDAVRKRLHDALQRKRQTKLK